MKMILKVILAALVLNGPVVFAAGCQHSHSSVLCCDKGGCPYEDEPDVQNCHKPACASLTNSQAAFTPGVETTSGQTGKGFEGVRGN